MGHHDKAYNWAARRRLETHPKTGAAQLVEIRETVQEILIPTYVETPRPPPVERALFDTITDDELLNYGVPVEWMGEVRGATTETLLSIADHLPGPENLSAALLLESSGS